MAEALRTETATLAHAEALAANMRQEDVDEAKACGFSPLEALRDSLRASEVALAALCGGEVLALYGVVPVNVEARGDALQGVVWALTSKAVDAHRMAFHREACRVVAALAAAYPRGVYNYIDARHATALRWVQRLGFVVLPVVPYGPHRLPFHPVVYVQR